MQVLEDPQAAELRAALRHGCEKAWTALYERYTPSLISYGLITCSHRPAYDVESIVASVWLSTWSRRHQLDEDIFLPSRFHAYLNLGVLNRIRDQSRRHTFRQEFPMASFMSALGFGNSAGDDADFTTLLEIIAGTFTSAPDPADLCERAETVDEVRTVLHEMTTDARHGHETRGQVLMLVHGHGLSYEEASEVLGITWLGVKSKIFRARRSFAKKWTEKHGALA